MPPKGANFTYLVHRKTAGADDFYDLVWCYYRAVGDFLKIILKLACGFLKGNRKSVSPISRFFRACGALFSANAVFCKEFISDFFQGLPFSLTNLISAPGRILRKKGRAPSRKF